MKDRFAPRSSAPAPVLVPMPAERPYTYAVPAGMEVVPGSIVRVPLGPREVAGIVWDGDADAVDPSKLQADLARSSTARRSTRDMRRFVDWIAAYTLSPPGMVARMLLRAPAAFDPEPLDRRACSAPAPARPHDRGARRACWSSPPTGWPGRAPAWRMRPACRSTVIDGLKAQGVFEPVMIPPRPVVAAPDPELSRSPS